MNIASLFLASNFLLVLFIFEGGVQETKLAAAFCDSAKG